MRLRFYFLVFTCVGFVGHLSAQCNKYQLFASDSVGCENDIFSFKVLPSPPSSSTLNWDFEVKKVNNTANPTVAFTNQDTLTVTLELILASQTCKLERKNYIKIGGIPEVKRINVSDKELCNTNEQAELTVVSPESKKLTWAIEGSVYNGVSKSIKHTFTKAGYSTLQLIAEGVFGCTNKLIFDSVLFVEKKPRVVFPFKDTTLCGKSTLKIKPEFTYFGQNQYTHAWSFQGGSPTASSKEYPDLVNYSSAGTYDVSLALASKTTSCKHNYNFSDFVVVENAPDLKLKAMPLNGAGCNSLIYGLKLSPGNLDSSKIVWSHKHEDSVVITNISGDSIIVRGRNTGNYTIYATYPFANCTKTVAVQIALKSNDLAANMDRGLSCICNIPSNVLVTNKSVHFNGKDMNYNWQLKNEKGKTLKNSTDTNFRWAADRYGKFILKLVATDSDGCSEEADYNFEARPFKIEFDAAPGSACPKTAITFKIRDTSCYNILDTVKWTLFELDKSIRKRRSTEEIIEKYQDTGWYSARVYAKTDKGCIDSISKDSVLHIVALDGITAEVPKGPFCVGDLVKMKYDIKPLSLAGDWYGVLINDDTTIYTIKGDSVFFTPPYPGKWDIKIVFTTEECTDSIVFKDAINVGGAIFDFTPATISGCLPFNTTIKSNILSNTVLGSSDQTLTYEWGISPQSRGSFLDKTAKNGDLTITKRGNVDLTLAVKNAQGCITQLTKKSLFSFSLSAGFELPDTFCKGLEYPVVNRSSGAIDTLLWSADGSGFSALPSDTTFSPELVFNDVGDYTVNLTVKDGGGCEETISKKIHIIDFGFSFSVDDTAAKCSPAPFEFTSAGTNVDSFVWNFGDGTPDEVTESTFLLKIYDLTRTAPYQNKFDVKLYATNSLGCVDSIVSRELLTVRGPVPNFEIVNHLGCEPLEVEFVDNSINAIKVYFDYGDDSSIDSVNYKKHTFTVQDSTDERQVYRPFIVVKDKFDCGYSYRTPDSVVVYSQPKARFSINKTKGCDPETFRFSDSSVFAHKWFWHFDDGDTLSDSMRLTSHRYARGKYDPHLVVENAIGCTDTAILKGLRIFETPIANFKPLDTLTCIGRFISFKDSSKAKHQVTKWQWDFGDTLSTKDSSTSKAPEFAFSAEGNYSVTLIVTDTNGCTDTLIKSDVIEIFDKLPVDSPIIDLVSVWNDLGLELDFSATPKFAFYSYQIEETNKDSILKTSRLRKDTSQLFSGLKPNKEAYCLRVVLTDKCDFTHPSDTHCTVLLGIDEQEKEVAHLSWSAYKGWNDLTHYSVYRGLKNEAIFPIAKLAATQLTYIDSSVCSEDYVYQIKAGRQRDSMLSESNSHKYKPEYVFQVNPLNMHVASVVNERVAVSWQQSVQRNVKHYAIDRWANQSAWIQNWKFTTDTFLTDSIAKTQDNYYYYRVRAIDACDYNSKRSEVASSILINANATIRDFELTWNPYKLWPKGVEKYILERKGPNSDIFLPLAEIAGTDTSYLDTSAFLLFDEAFAYRVMAIENTLLSDTSVSNIRLVKPLPTLFIPNAFSPNDDGINDVFSFKSFALLPDSVANNNFEMRIYNRWGEEVFLSNNITKGWDGTFNGVLCSPGSYVYLLKAQGKNGNLLFRKGGITLLR